MEVHMEPRLELANKLDGREYGDEITKDEEQEAKSAGLVVLFGASDDLMEFRGAINDEIGCWEALLTNKGLLHNTCDSDNCPHFAKLKETAAVIEAKWDKDGFSWVYETKIPHTSFKVMEDGENYCKGIVFALADVQ